MRSGVGVQTEADPANFYFFSRSFLGIAVVHGGQTRAVCVGHYAHWWEDCCGQYDICWSLQCKELAQPESVLEYPDDSVISWYVLYRSTWVWTVTYGIGLTKLSILIGNDDSDVECNLMLVKTSRQHPFSLFIIGQARHGDENVAHFWRRQVKHTPWRFQALFQLLRNILRRNPGLFFCSSVAGWQTMNFRAIERGRIGYGLLMHAGILLSIRS